MPEYKWTAKDKDGRKQKGKLNAYNKQQAFQILHNRGLSWPEVKPVETAQPSKYPVAQKPWNWPGTIGFGFLLGAAAFVFLSDVSGSGTGTEFPVIGICFSLCLLLAFIFSLVGNVTRKDYRRGGFLAGVTLLLMLFVIAGIGIRLFAALSS